VKRFHSGYTSLLPQPLDREHKQYKISNRGDATKFDYFLQREVSRYRANLCHDNEW